MSMRYSVLGLSARDFGVYKDLVSDCCYEIRNDLARKFLQKHLKDLVSNHYSG